MGRSRWHLPRYLSLTTIIVVFATLSGVVAAFFFPTLPSVLVMATGPAGSVYSEFDQRYQEILARQGVHLTLQSTAGAIENLSLLGDGQSGVSIALVESGLTNPRRSPDLVSLGTFAFEPLWIFCRGGQIASSARLNELRGKRLSIGPAGSGTQDVVIRLLAQNGIDVSNAELLPLAPDVAAVQLAKGAIDVAIILTSFDAPAVKQLLGSPDVSLISLTRADAYIALYPFMSKLILPSGAVDLAHNRPPADVQMLALKTSLIVRRDLPPAVQYLLLDAATEIHSPPELFQKAGEFPAAEMIDLPLSENARRFYKTGMPFLQHYLPLWLAVLTEQLAILLIPVAGVAYPLLRGLPAIYAWGVQRRIYSLYGELKLFELKLEDREREQSSERCWLSFPTWKTALVDCGFPFPSRRCSTAYGTT